MSFDWSNIASAGIGAIGNVVGGLASNSLSAYEQEQMARLQASLNYKYWKKQQLNQPLFSRQGLEKANYNPMLALSNIGAGAGTSSWTSGSSYTAPDLSGIGNGAISNALAVRQQDNQNMITEAQTNNYNADSVLKNNQAITELYSQLEKLNHADLMQAQKTLTDKNVSWYDRQQAREDLRVANEIERTGNDFKVGMAQAIASQIGANASVIGANANAKDVTNRYELGKEQLKWDKKKWSIGSTVAGLGSLAIPGFNYIKGAKASSQMFKALHFMK